PPACSSAPHTSLHLLCFCLLQNDVLVNPQLARQPPALIQSLAQLLFLFPVGRRQMLGPLQHTTRTLGALAHAATVGQMRKGELLDARPDHQIRVLLHLAHMSLAVFMKSNGWHKTSCLLPMMRPDCEP